MNNVQINNGALFQLQFKQAQLLIINLHIINFLLVLREIFCTLVNTGCFFSQLH
jgi:hypothetical protein